MNIRAAKYSAKKVYLPNSSRIGYGVAFAKPGHWVAFKDGGEYGRHGRVLGRIDATPSDGGPDCEGYLAVMTLGDCLTHAFVRFVNPADVEDCREQPPRALLAWIAGEEWVTRGAEIGRYVAMADYGSTSEHYIEARNDPEKPYNKSPEYVAQFVLE